MPINGRPLLAIWLELLLAAGIETIVVNLHHHADLVCAYIGRSPYAPFVTLSFEEELLGTGGTLLRNAGKLLPGPVLLAHVDNLSRFDLWEFLAAHRDRPPRTALTMMTFRTDLPRACGIVELDHDGVVVSLHEKSADPPGNLANAAVYLLEPEVLSFVAGIGRDTIDFSTEVLPAFVGRMATFHNAGYHRDIGTVASLLRAQIEYALSYRPAAAAADPYCGLMSDDDGRLARSFLAALDTVGLDTKPILT